MKRDWIRALFALAVAGSVMAAPPENDTHFQTQTFVMDLPGTWKQLPSDEAVVFLRGADTLFIAPLETKKKLNWREAKAAAAKLADIRRGALTEIAQGKVTLTQTLGTVKDERQVFYFGGVDSLNKKRVYVAVVGLPDVLVTITLSRPITAGAAGFDELSARLMWSVRSPAG